MEKKLVLLLNEGDTDVIALKGAINRYLQFKKVDTLLECVVYGADFTIHEFKDKDLDNPPLMKDPDMVLDNVAKLFQEFLSDPKANPNKYQATDFIAVATLSDLDCCYVNDAMVQHGLGPNGESTYYDVTNGQILCNDVVFIRNRNELKRNSLGILSSETKINFGTNCVCSINLHAYYCSINLEHALYDSLGSFSPKEKKDKAKTFSHGYIAKDSNAFYQYLDGLNIVGKTYLDSWDENTLVKKPFERYSNISMLLDWIIELSKEVK